MNKNYIFKFTILLFVFFMGCAIHQQSPIKIVPYDFSDYNYYDKGYAPSPQYLSDAGADGSDNVEKEDNKKIKVQIIIENTK